MEEGARQWRRAVETLLSVLDIAINQADKRKEVSEWVIQQAKQALEDHRRTLAAVARSMDGWGDVDLHERAFEIALERDPSYESGDKDPTDDDYAQALLEAVLEQRTHNPKVAGSIPARPTNRLREDRWKIDGTGI